MTFSRSQWQQVEALFHAASELPAGERAAFLDARCGGDAALRQAVQRLLDADGGAAPGDDFVEQGALGVLRGRDPLLGQVCGAFRLVERIAEGGMGAVYRAERIGGDFQQEVAVKVLRVGLSTGRMRERFTHERQLLARLVHPNVARLIDGGTTDQDVPFIAMELIDGLPLDRYCDARHAPLGERLRLFVTVCRAVHFAHQSLVVHLDLKPGNILVDRTGTPKLLDFGVAGLLAEVGAAGEIAATRSRPLTPEYASPEQLRGEPVSTAADVYALGAVLYELLTGVRPFRRTGGGDAEYARTVCETEALRPSATFTTVTPDSDPEASGSARAERRGDSVAAVARSLRGDLDRIVLKALRKEPARRYASCQEFADDVVRFLEGFPVIARDPSVGYRLSRFVRRNRAVVAAAVLLLLVLVAGIVATLHLAEVARGERDVADAARARVELEMAHARVEASSSRGIAEFLGETFLSADFLGNAAARERVQRNLLRRAERVRREHADAPHLRANLLDALGRISLELDLFADAETLIREAMAIRAQDAGKASLEYALSLQSLGRLRYRQGRFGPAAEAFRACLGLHRSCAPGVHTDVAGAANDLAAALRAGGDRGAAEPLHREALALRQAAAAGGDSALVAESLNNLASTLADPAQAEPLLAQALAMRTRMLGADDPLTIQSGINLARAALQRRDFATAAPLLRSAVVAARRGGGPASDSLSQALASLGFVEAELGNLPAAVAAADEAVALDQARFPDPHPRVAADLEVRAKIAERAQDADGALSRWREVLRIRRACLPEGHPAIANTLTSLGGVLAASGQAEAAIGVLGEALARHRASAASAGEVGEVQANLADAYERAGRLPEAEQALLAALAALRADPSRARLVPWLRGRIQAFYQRHGRDADAARFADPPASRGG